MRPQLQVESTPEDCFPYFSYHDAAPPNSDMSYSDVIFGDVLLSPGHCYREARRKKGWR
jgi:hypothetical protein